MKKKLSVIIVLTMVLTMFISSNVFAEEINSQTEICESIDLETGEVSTYTIDKEIPIGRSLTLEGSSGTLPTDLDINENMLPQNRSIIGNDNRYIIKNPDVVPYRFVADMRMVFPNGKTFVGTAWLMSESSAVTCAHCLYSKDNGGYAKSVTIYPGRNGSSMPYGGVKAKKLNVIKEYKTKPGIDYDYGVIQLSSPIGKKVGYFGFEYTVGTAINGKTVTVAGYPGEGKNRLYKNSGKILSSTAKTLSYKMDTTGGQSGAPIYYKNANNSFLSVGIHGYGGNTSNSGRRIDKLLFNWLSKFK